MKLTKIELPFEVVAAFAKLSQAIGNPTEVESEYEHVETEIIERAAARIAELEKALRGKHACCCNECAREIERLLPDTIVS